MNRYRALFPLLTVLGAYAGPVAAANAEPAPSGDQLAQARPSSSAKPTDPRALREAQLAARQKLLSNADALIKAGRPGDAYALLIPYQSAMAGDVDYDYLLGLAAVDSGKPNEAIFALERVLAVSPNNLQARAEIARAYLAAGELDASRQEFQTVQQQNPPKEVSATIQKYLDIIAADTSGRATSIRGYVEASVGNDSNVNSATSSSQIAVPFFGGAVMTMSADGLEKRDNFGSIAAGINMRHAFNSEWAMLGGANVNQRSNSTEHAFNTRNLDGNIGASRTIGDDNYLALLQLQSFTLNDKTYRNAAGATGQWQRNFGDGSQGSMYLQYTQLTYPDFKTRDANRYVLGGAYATALSGNTPIVVYGGAYAGTENVKDSTYDYLSNILLGLRAGGEIKLTTQYTLIGSASLESRSYSGDDPLFLTKRSDTQLDLRIALGYSPAQSWMLTPALSYTNNDSNIVIYKYQRTMASISLRHDFN